MGITTIQIEDDVREELKKAKKYERQTYSELLRELLRISKNARLNNQYDEYLHKIQQEKMKELWDNAEDEAWEDA